ncbi:MAG: hypothetical protein ACL7BU_15130 [Candidatus Phlomobacter fragariae]
MSFIVKNSLSIEKISLVLVIFAILNRQFKNFVINVVCIFFLKMHKIESSYVNTTLCEKSKMGFLVTQFYVDGKPMYYNTVVETALLTEQNIFNTKK